MKNYNTVLIAGDTHGDLRQFDYLLSCTIEFQCGALLQCGDFGYWEHAPDGSEFLDGVEEMIRNSGIPIYWIDGNHDHQEWLLNRYEPNEDGTYEIRRNLFYLPRGYSWEWGGKRWLALGGGNSIDRAWRERQTAKSGFEFWWESEAITDGEVASCLAQPKADIMVTHDAPGTVDIAWQFHKAGIRGLNVPPSFKENRDRIQVVVDHHKPELLFHGHLHIPYTDIPYDGAPKVVALANDGTMQDSWTVWNR